MFCTLTVAMDYRSLSPLRKSLNPAQERHWLLVNLLSRMRWLEHSKTHKLEGFRACIVLVGSYMLQARHFEIKEKPYFPL